MASEPKIPDLTGVTMESLHGAVERLATERGWLNGVAIPSISDMDAPLIIAKGAPLYGDPYVQERTFRDGFRFMAAELAPEDQREYSRECHGDIESLRYVNEWAVPGHEIIVYTQGGGSKYVRKSLASIRVDTMMKTMSLRIGAVTITAELKAIANLFSRLNQTQMESYILNGMFAETSPRSHVTYVLRKGLPTLAMKKDEVAGKANFLAALCLHPLAYYYGSLCGSLPPSDEVLAHLLMIRADEYNFWKKSGQHTLNDPMSGI